MTEAQLLQYVYAHLGGEEESNLPKPKVIALAKLALKDFVEFLVEKKPDQAQRFTAYIASQSWADFSFQAPTNMLYKNQLQFTKIKIGDTDAHQLENVRKLDMITSKTPTYYYALKGEKFFFNEVVGSSGSTLSIHYIKIPVITDIGDELTPDFLNFVFMRLANGQASTNNTNSK